MILGGGAGIGKSWTLLSMGRALSLGERPFACPMFSVDRPARVLLIEHELKPYGLQIRVKKVFEGVSLQALEDTFWYVSGEPALQFSSPEGRAGIERLVDEIQPEVLLLDPIGKMHYFDENDNGEISRLMYYLDVLLKRGRSWGMSLVFTHHFGKPSNDPRVRDFVDPLDAYSFRGASKWKDDPDIRVTWTKGQYLATAWPAWKMTSRWLTRQGEQMADLVFTFNKNNDGRVLFDHEIPNGGQGGPLAPPRAYGVLPEVSAAIPEESVLESAPGVPVAEPFPPTGDRGLLRF